MLTVLLAAFLLAPAPSVWGQSALDKLKERKEQLTKEKAAKEAEQKKKDEAQRKAEEARQAAREKAEEARREAEKKAEEKRKAEEAKRAEEKEAAKKVEKKPEEAKKTSKKAESDEPEAEAEAEDENVPAELKELRSTRDERRAKEVEKIRARWGELVNESASRAELRRHARRVAFLQRARAVAEEDKTLAKLVVQIDELLTQEETRHGKVMNALRQGETAK